MKIELFIHPDKTGIRDIVSRTAAFLHSHGAELWVPAPYGDLPQVSVGLCPDPDLIVRTAGEQRLSNFLLWQAAYSEFYFTKTLWPDLSNREIDEIVTDFKKRVRRYGAVVTTDGEKGVNA